MIVGKLMLLRAAFALDFEESDSSASDSGARLLAAVAGTQSDWDF